MQLREKDHPPPHVHLTSGALEVVPGLETVEVLAPDSHRLARAAEDTGRYTVTRKP